MAAVTAAHPDHGGAGTGGRRLLRAVWRRIASWDLGTMGQWVAIGISVLLAVDARTAATRDPEINALLPALVRVAQGREDSPYGFAWLYVQPTFYSATTNDRVEVVADMRLEVRRLDADGPRAAPQAFEWAQVAAFSFDPAANAFDYHYVSDPEPLLVGADNAEAPLGVFNGPAGWYFEAGTYEVTLVAELAVTKEAKRYAPFRLAFTPAQIDELNRSQGGTFLTFPLEDGGPADGTPAP